MLRISRCGKDKVTELQLTFYRQRAGSFIKDAVHTAL
jgi:hypothetical protein